MPKIINDSVSGNFSIIRLPCSAADSKDSASAVKGAYYTAFWSFGARRLCRADEAQQGRNSCPWLLLSG